MRQLEKRISKIESKAGQSDPCHMAFQGLDGNYTVHHNKHGRFDMNKAEFERFEAANRVIILTPDREEYQHPDIG